MYSLLNAMILFFKYKINQAYWWSVHNCCRFPIIFLFFSIFIFKLEHFRCCTGSHSRQRWPLSDHGRAGAQLDSRSQHALFNALLRNVRLLRRLRIQGGPTRQGGHLWWDTARHSERNGHVPVVAATRRDGQQCPWHPILWASCQRLQLPPLQQPQALAHRVLRSACPTCRRPEHACCQSSFQRAQRRPDGAATDGAHEPWHDGRRLRWPNGTTCCRLRRQPRVCSVPRREVCDTTDGEGPLGEHTSRRCTALWQDKGFGISWGMQIEMSCILK